MKKIRLAIIGCGGFVRYHVREMVANVPPLECVGLCDIIPEHSQRLSDELFIKDAKVRPPSFIKSSPTIARCCESSVPMPSTYPRPTRSASATRTMPFIKDSSGAHVMVD